MKKRRMAKLAVASACPPPDRLESEKIAHLPDDRFIEALLNYDGIPLVLLENRQLLDMFLPMLKADFRLSEDYVCEDNTPIKCPICAMGANQDYDALEPAIKAWASYTLDDFAYRMFEGTHFYIKEKEQEVLSQIKEYFDSKNINGHHDSSGYYGSARTFMCHSNSCTWWNCYNWWEYKDNLYCSTHSCSNVIKIMFQSLFIT